MTIEYLHATRRGHEDAIHRVQRQSVGAAFLAGPHIVYPRERALIPYAAIRLNVERKNRFTDGVIHN
jgi:hypothetical protein